MINNDAAGGAQTGWQRVQKVTPNIIAFSLVIYAFFAPHSIAITQAGFLIGLVAWGVDLIVSRKFRQPRTPVDVAIFGFFACCVVSSFFSYELLTSVKGLKSPAFFLAFYFLVSNIKSLRMARTLIMILVASCLINVIYSAGQVAVGRGLQINRIEKDGAFDREGFAPGDVILKADDQNVKALGDLSRIADESRGRMQIVFQRDEALIEGSVSRKAIRKSGKDGTDRLGITTSPGRSFRVSGFYSHYETYAEVLQMIAALAFGLFIALPRKKSLNAVLLAVAIVLTTGTLIMTSTRAALVGLSIGILTVAFMSYRRRAVILAVAAMILLAPLAYFAIKHSRGDILFNPNEASTTYRLEVWREALGLIRDHPLTGIGKGSEGGFRLKEKYALYNNGKLPPGHFHSTYIQVAAWWGLPALAFYISMMTIFFIEMWRLNRRLREKRAWKEWGIVLGATGALVAFNVSAVGHFNFGDGEVVMLFWLITGIVFAVRRLTSQEPAFESGKQIIVLPTEEDSQKSRLREPAVASEAGARAAAATQNSQPPQ